MAVDRRTLLRAAGAAAITAPFAAARFVVEGESKKLPHVYKGDVMTAESFNALIDRVNALSERGF